ncbi:rifin [Plasmodium reichenowi]|uniref:Rifin n=1 Tax=Plasmodium reichenowi TaxID=5854 RepID=A0A060RMD4_PLARE|nr:rifin [Plasmodium reichenowi]
MKVHYINILLFALPLNILVYNQRNHKSPTPHTPKIPTNRSLCECELYEPANYDNDPHMKKLMQQFEDRTSQRFHEYDERLQAKRKQCKDKCDKEIQKIILKDKLEKEFMDKFVTLHTDIQSDAIPTCVCEKSMADKMEKGCLQCGGVLGGGVAPSVGLLGGIGIYGWEMVALAAAKKAAIAKGLLFGKIVGDAKGMEIVIKGLDVLKADKLIPEIFNSFKNSRHYTEVLDLVDIINTQLNTTCSTGATAHVQNSICVVRETLGVIPKAGGKMVEQKTAITNVLDKALAKATSSANAAAKIAKKEVTAAAIEKNTGAVGTASYNLYNAIGYSVLAILIIVLIMVIIYLILRYRRKKKMKKKLQYIKLLEE